MILADPDNINKNCFKKICSQFKHLSVSVIPREPNGLCGFAVNEFDFMRNVEIGKQRTIRTHKRSIGTQTATEREKGTFCASPSIFSKEFKESK